MARPGKIRPGRCLSALVLVSVLGGLLAISAWTLVARSGDLPVLKGAAFPDLIEGAAASRFETALQRELTIRDSIVGLWGAVSFRIFQTGKDGVLLGRDGWLFTTEEFATSDQEASTVTQTIDLIARVRLWLAARDSALVVALIPAKARIEKARLGRLAWPEAKVRLYDRARKDLAAAGVLVPDLRQPLLDLSAKRAAFLKTDTHWTPQGAQGVAYRLAQAVAADCGGLEIAGRPFAAVPSEERARQGDLTRFVPTGPFNAWLGPAAETVQAIEARALATGAEGGSAGLFGELAIPIALVGTSYSAMEEWGFDQALRLAFQADVLNLADLGGGPLAPMAAFLTDLEAGDVAAPALVIWEIPERFLGTAYDTSFPTSLFDRSPPQLASICLPKGRATQIAPKETIGPRPTEQGG